MQNKNKTVVRSMDLLNLFLSETRLNINEIVRLSGIPKTSVLRMLGSLEDMGFLDKDRDGYYTLGLLFLQFGNLVAERLDIRHVALPAMEKLRDEIGEAVHLVIRDGWESRYIEKLDTHHPVRLFTKIGRKAPLYAGASSRVILAFMPEEERLEYLSSIELRPIGSGTITSKEELQEALDLTRENRYSFSLSELENYTAELSAPVFDHHGQIAAALSIAGLDVRFSEEHMPELVGKLQEAAETVSRKLGWNAPLPLHI